MPSEIERFEPRARAAGAVLMEWVHEGRFIYHSDHLAQLAAKDEEIKRQHRLRIHAAQAHIKALTKRDEEIERLKAIERDIRIRAEDRLERLERAEQKADANREDALANLDALEKHRRARVLAEQALPAELEKLAEELEERHDRKRKLARICAAANQPESSILVNIAAEDAFIAHRLRERAAELREGAA